MSNDPIRDQLLDALKWIVERGWNSVPGYSRAKAAIAKAEQATEPAYEPTRIEREDGIIIEAKAVDRGTWTQIVWFAMRDGKEDIGLTISEAVEHLKARECLTP